MVVQLNESELIKVISDSINEYFEEYAKFSNEIIIRTYFMNDPDDVLFIQNNFDKIMDILNFAYKSVGGMLGISNKKSLIKNKSFICLAFYNNEIVAVAIYSNRMGGNKLEYGGGIGGEYRKQGGIAFHSIAYRDIEHTEEYVWLEASHNVERVFRDHNAYNLPNKYVQQIFPNKKIELVGEFYYKRLIGDEKNGKWVQKTIFGIKDEQLLTQIVKDTFGKVSGVAEELYKKLYEYQNNIYEASNEAMETLLNMACEVIDLFEECCFVSGNYELPRRFIYLIDSTGKMLKKVFYGNKRAQIYVQKAINILNSVTVLEPIYVKIKF